MQKERSAPSEPKTYELPEDPRHARPKTVLILEDELDFAATVKDVLEEQDYRVTVVPNGAVGVQRILAADFDAVLCDMVMPGFPGDMFYLAVQRSRPHLCERFIFMTGHPSEPRVAKFLAGVKNRTLAKPFEMRHLFDALESVTGRSR
jgi:DNA-binding response OmpR family regulator